MPSPAPHLPGPPTPRPEQPDVLILGGGVAGLMCLDALARAGYHTLLLEHHALGAGQTVWSQGIIHSGLKYTLSGGLTDAARAIRDMPARWARCLAGDDAPDLTTARVLSPHCVLWRTGSLTSRLGMFGARAGLRVKPAALAPDDRPPVLARCPDAARLDEPVVDPASVVAALARPHAARIRRGSLDDARAAHLTPRLTLLAAGAGNAPLRAELGLPDHAQQIRPLRMILARAAPGAEPLPPLFGHCVDAAHTRVTITSHPLDDSDTNWVWQVGGQLAEDGPALDPGEHLRLAARELAHSIPGLDPGRLELAAYDAPRAEPRTRAGKRPDDAALLTDGDVFTAWPVKLALAPLLADRAVRATHAALGPPPSPPPPAATDPRPIPAAFVALPAPPLADPPWRHTDWTRPN